MQSTRFSSLPHRRAAVSVLLMLASQAGAGDLPAAERDVFSLPSSLGAGPQLVNSSSGPATVPVSGCSFPGWVRGRPYAALDIVTYDSRPYFAKSENPGYIPAVSTYFWGPYSCPVTSAAPARCTYTEWMRDWPYASGSVVAFEGRYYVARHDNPGYVPTVSTWFWAPHDCGAPTSASVGR